MSSRVVGAAAWLFSRTQPVGMAGKAQASIHALAPVQQPANPRRRRCSRARVANAAHSFAPYTRRVQRTPPARNAFSAARVFAHAAFVPEVSRLKQNDQANEAGFLLRDRDSNSPPVYFLKTHNYNNNIIINYDIDDALARRQRQSRGIVTNRKYYNARRQPENNATAALKIAAAHAVPERLPRPGDGPRRFAGDDDDDDAAPVRAHMLQLRPSRNRLPLVVPSSSREYLLGNSVGAITRRLYDSGRAIFLAWCRHGQCDI